MSEEKEEVAKQLAIDFVGLRGDVLKHTIELGALKLLVSFLLAYLIKSSGDPDRCVELLRGNFPGRDDAFGARINDIIDNAASAHVIKKEDGGSS